jgi:hypothetical protein
MNFSRLTDKALRGVRRRPRYITYKRRPDKISIFEDFANGLGMPAAARRALGLDPETAGSGPYGQASGTSADIAGGSPGDVQPLLSNLLRASAVPVLSALREILHGYIEADRLMGSICVTGPISLQMPVVERAGFPLGLELLELLGDLDPRAAGDLVPPPRLPVRAVAKRDRAIPAALGLVLVNRSFVAPATPGARCIATHEYERHRK